MNTQPKDNTNQVPFSLIDLIGTKPRTNLSPQKTYEDITNSRLIQNDSKNFEQSSGSPKKKPENYSIDYSQTRNPSNLSVMTKLRENRSIAGNIPVMVEDSLDKFQKEHLRENHSPTYGNERYSPSYRNSPQKVGPQEGSSPTLKKDSSLANSYLGGLNLNSIPSEPSQNRSPTLSSLSKSTKKSQIKQIDKEILSHQKFLEQRLDQSTKPRNYNIVTNETSSPPPSIYAGLPFGFVARSLERGLEDVHLETVKQFKKVESTSPSRSPIRRQESYMSPKQQKSFEFQLENLGVVAGKNNFYGETEFRYANKLPNQEPLSPTQIYNAKALKNLSGVKLY